MSTLLYEGKAKKIYSTKDNDKIIAEFKDDLTAFNAQKKGQEKGKGELNCQISSQIFTMLRKHNIQTHFIDVIEKNKMLCKKVDIILAEVIVRNIAAGSIIKRLGIAQNTIFNPPLVELCYKNDDYGDPVINDEHMLALDIVKNDDEISVLKTQARKINQILIGFFDKIEILLVDFKIEFGRDIQGNIIVADEISPDSCRLWDKNTKQKLDKDRFRESIGNIAQTYKEVLDRIKG